MPIPLPIRLSANLITEYAIPGHQVFALIHITMLSICLAVQTMGVGIGPDLYVWSVCAVLYGASDNAINIMYVLLQIYMIFEPFVGSSIKLMFNLIVFRNVFSTRLDLNRHNIELKNSFERKTRIEVNFGQRFGHLSDPSPKI